MSRQMANYLHYNLVTLDLPAFQTHSICLSDCADGNQLLTFQSLERLPSVRFTKLLRSILMTTDLITDLQIRPSADRFNGTHLGLWQSFLK